jgi:hypothetical protein
MLHVSGNVPLKISEWSTWECLKESVLNFSWEAFRRDAQVKYMCGQISQSTDNNEDDH